MATAIITIQGEITGLAEGQNRIGFAYSNSSAPGTRDLVSLTTTPTALSIPSGTLFILVVPPSSNTTNIKISGATGETTGATLHPSNPTIIPVPSSSPVVYLFSASGTISSVQIYYL